MPKIQVHKAFTLTNDDGTTQEFTVGSHNVDKAVADHWFVKHHISEDAEEQAAQEKAAADAAAQAEATAKAEADAQAKREAEAKALADKEAAEAANREPATPKGSAQTKG